MEVGQWRCYSFRMLDRREHLLVEVAFSPELLLEEHRHLAHNMQVDAYLRSGTGPEGRARAPLAEAQGHDLHIGPLNASLAGDVVRLPRDSWRLTASGDPGEWVGAWRLCLRAAFPTAANTYYAEEGGGGGGGGGGSG